MPDETPEVNPDRLYEQGIDTSIKMNTEAAASPDAEEARQEEARPEPASEPAPAPKPVEGPSEDAELREQLRMERERAERLERDYSAASREGKKYGEAKKLLKTLKEKYALEELEGIPLPEEEVPEEDRPITRRELEAIQTANAWQTARDTFFSLEKNSDLASPMRQRMVCQAVLDLRGNPIHRDPKEAFRLAGEAVRKEFASERLKGRQEREMTREDIKKAAVAEGTGKPPEKKPEPQEEKPDENEYASMWRKFKEKRG